MAPKIRGVSPAIRRFSKPNSLGVKTPQKGKGTKKKAIVTPKANGTPIANGTPKSNGTQKSNGSPKASTPPDAANALGQLLKGEDVDVRLDEEGLHGSWHPAIICGVKRGLRQVKFRNLMDSRKNPIREWVPFGSLPMEQPLGTRKAIDMPVIRPGGPGLPPLEPSFQKTGGWPKDLWVEVFSEEAWWEGVLGKDVSAAQIDDQSSVVEVLFPQLDDIVEQVTMENIRECKDWDATTGSWTVRGIRDPDDDVSGDALPEQAVEGMEDGDVAMEDPAAAAENVAVQNGVGVAVEGVAKDNVDVGVILSEGTDMILAKVVITDKIQDALLPSTARSSVKLASIGVNTSEQPAGRVAEWGPSDIVKNQFGRLMNVVEDKTQFVLTVYTSGYTLQEMEISVQGKCLFIDARSTGELEKFGNFTCKVGGAFNSRLGLPTDGSVDDQNIGWVVEGDKLIVTVPIAVSAHDVNSFVATASG